MPKNGVYLHPIQVTTAVQLVKCYLLVQSFRAELNRTNVGETTQDLAIYFVCLHIVYPENKQRVVLLERRSQLLHTSNAPSQSNHPIPSHEMTQTIDSKEAAMPWCQQVLRESLICGLLMQQT